MTYPGNNSLAPEIQNRILSTFRQTIDLAEKGRLQEARLGCDFILKMDSQFAAAKQLKARLEGASGPVKASDLEALASAPPAAEPVGDLSDDSGGVLDLDLDLGDDFGDLDFADTTTQASPPAASPDPFADPPGGTSELDPLGGFELPEVPPASSAQTAPAATGAPAPDELLPELEAAPPAAAPGSGNPRIDELLAEGQAAFDQGEHQAAIDAWSRIFLIDIDHEEAGRRIEEARYLKAERERQGDELLNEAIRARDEGRLDDARERLEGLLAEQPESLQARELLEQLDVADGAGAPPPPPSPVAAQAPEGEAAAEEVLEADLPPPAPRASGPAPAPSFPGGVGKARGGGFNPLLLAGGLVFLLVVVAAWFLYSNWGSLFPNAVVEEPAPQAPERPSPLRRANQLRLDGDVEAAIEVLNGVPADDPEAAQARTLLDQLEAEIAAKAAEEQAAAELEATRLTSRQRLLEEARRAYDERQYLEAARTFRAADELAPLEGAAADLYRDTREQLLPIAQQIDMFRQREWEQVLPTLWRKHEEDPANRDVHRILTDSYYNLAIRDLKRGDAASASDSLREVVGLDAEDALSERLLQFSTSYQERSVDLLYRIFVGKLEFRQ